MNRELKNGIVHVSVAILALAPAAYFGGVAGWAFAGFCYAAVRETTEEQLKHPTLSLVEAFIDGLTSWRDYLGWTLGGVAIGLATVLR